MTKVHLRNSDTRHFTSIVSIVLALVIFVGMLMLTTTTAYAASGFKVGSTVYVNVEDNLHLHDGSQGPIVGRVPRGTALTIISGPDRNTYYKVRVNSTGEVWWVYGVYLTDSYIEPRKAAKPVGSSTTVEGSTTHQTQTTSTSSTSTTTSKSRIDIEQEKLARAHKNEPYIGELNPKYVLYYDNVTADYTSSEGTIMYVQTQSGLNLRTKPDVKSARVRLLRRGEVLTVFPDTLQNDFVRAIAWLDGSEGWVHRDYIKFSQPSDISYVGYWNSEALVNILGADWEDDQDHCCGNQERSEEWHRIFGD